MNLNTAGAQTSAKVAKEARDKTIQRLGLASLIIWLAGMFWLMLTVQDADVYVVGGQYSVLFMIPAALPWLAYRWMVRREIKKQDEATRG